MLEASKHHSCLSVCLHTQPSTCKPILYRVFLESPYPRHTDRHVCLDALSIWSTLHFMLPLVLIPAHCAGARLCTLCRGECWIRGFQENSIENRFARDSAWEYDYSKVVLLIK